jgi:cathepsin B
MTAVLSFFVALILLSIMNSQRTQYNQIIQQVNQVNAGWSAGMISGFDYDDETSLIGKLGTIPISEDEAQNELSDIRNNNLDSEKFPTPQSAAILSSNQPRKLQAIAGVSYPASLDLRIKYPKCKSISLIRNQSSCGGCWAFATINSLTDRWCISKTLSVGNQRYFSVQDVLECCSSCNAGSGNGCKGGIPSFAFKHARDVGLVSGELTSINGGMCKPFFLDVRPKTSLVPKACSALCTNTTTFKTSYSSDKTKLKGYSLGKGESEMIAALNKGGPIAVSFKVYQDLYSYRSGIYKFVSGRILGGHSVRLIGYGIEGGVKFWLLANSWGVQWGEKGFFRMRRGTNECNIETSYHTYALP